MSDWQKILRDESISTLDELKSYVTERFGAVAAEREIDVEALKPAFDNFQMRITRESLSQMTFRGATYRARPVPSVTYVLFGFRQPLSFGPAAPTPPQPTPR